MSAISPARAANMATHAWTKLYTGIMAFMSTIYAWPYLKRPRQSTTVHIYFCTACERPVVGTNTNQN